MLTIRRYMAQDKERVYRLHTAGIEQVGSSFGPGPWDDDLSDIEGVYLLGGDGDFLVGEEEGELVAMGALRRKSDGVGEIKRMRVLQAFQGRGYGKRMLQLLEEKAEALGYRTLVLDTTGKSIAALGLYRSFGYRETRRVPFQGTELIFLEKSIAGPCTG